MTATAGPHLLVLTEAGRELYADVAPKALELESQLFAGFTPDELEAFVTMLHRIDAVALAQRDQPRWCGKAQVPSAIRSTEKRSPPPFDRRPADLADPTDRIDKPVRHSRRGSR